MINIHCLKNDYLVHIVKETLINLQSDNLFDTEYVKLKNSLVAIGQKVYCRANKIEGERVEPRRYILDVTSRT